jgi:anti-anti-sigma factor
MKAHDTEDAFTIERHGEVTLIVASAALETMEPALVESASALMLEPIRRQQSPLVVIDIDNLKYFGSTFVTLLVRCWKLATDKGGQMALAGASAQARDLLKLTSLDIVLPIYANRREAMDALSAD